MDSHGDPADDSLSIESLTLIDRVCVAFEENYKSGETVSMEKYLVGVSEPLLTSLLCELLFLEIDYRFRRGEKPVESDYTAKFPEHKTVVANVFDRANRYAPDVLDAPETNTNNPQSLSSSEQFIKPGKKIGRYTVLQELGHGGFGTVYLARDEELQRQVAIKIPLRQRFQSFDQMSRFVVEARTAANLKHDGIVPIHDVGRDENGLPFVVMEYLDGDSLEATLSSGQLTFRQIAELMAEVADAVHHAHRQGIVHRDLKPSNIIFDARGRACITDFGLAERWEPNSDTSSTTSPALAGTYQFIPPELFDGTGVLEPRIDIYALGVILYRALTRRIPFESNSLHELKKLIQDGRPPLPQEIDPNIPEKLQRICLKALDDRVHRYESARMLSDELRRFLEGREVQARPRRYDAELQGKLRNHYAAIHSWQEQNLISVKAMDRLCRPYWFLLRSDSPWPSLTHLYPLEAIAIRLGGWLVLLSTLLWPWFYWGQLSTLARITSVAFPTVALNGVGWTLNYLGSKWNARIFLGSGALLLPLMVAVVLGEFRMLRFAQSADWEFFAAFEEKQWSLTNAQFTIAIATFLAYCIFLFRHFPGKIFVIWLAIGIYVFFTGCLGLCGLKVWVNHEHVSRSLICFFLPCLFLLIGPLVWNRMDHRGEGAVLYAFFPGPFVLLMTLLAFYGSSEWLDVDIRNESVFHNETINLWWMFNGSIYASAAMLCQRANVGFIRFWSTFFALLVPISLLLPCNLLIDEGWQLISLGEAPMTIYELLSGLFSVSFIVLGTVTNRSSLSLPGLIGLAVVVYQFTFRHFPNESSWPLCLALSGGVAMLAGVVSAVVRARFHERTGRLLNTR